MEVQLGRLWKSPLNWQPTGPLNRALGIGNRYLFIPACILTFMALGLVTSISAAHDMFAYRGILPPLPRAPLVTGVTEIFAVLWLFEMAERFTKNRWEHMRPLLPRWSKILLVTLLCLLLLYVTNTHSHS
jgi:hypothetical protein